MKSKSLGRGWWLRLVVAVLGLVWWSEAAIALDRWEESTKAGIKFQKQEKMTEAEDHLWEALSEAEKSGDQDWRLAKSFHNLGAFLYDRGKYPEAESLYQKAIATMQKQPGFDHRDLAGMLNNLALLYKNQGRFS